MTRLKRLFALLAALGGFAAAHVVTQSGQAMELPPVTSVTTVLPTLPLPPLPTTALPPPPTTVLPPPPTTTVPLPVPVRPLPLPPVPTVTTAPILPAPLPPPQTGTLPRIPPPAPAPSAISPAPAAPTTPLSSTPPATSNGSSGAGSATADSGATTGSTARSQRLRASERRTARRISVRLAFTLPKAGRIFLVVRGPAPSCRVAGVIPVRGRRGANTVYFTGRVHGRRLEPGLYLISLSPTPRVDADAPAELVRVVSRTRSVPAPDAATRPACGTAETPGAGASTLARDTLPTPPTVRPAGPLRPPLPGGDPEDGEDGEDDSAGFLPIPAALVPDTGTEAFATIALVMLVGALLLAIVALVTRFVRGSWNP